MCKTEVGHRYPYMNDNDPIQSPSNLTAVSPPDFPCVSIFVLQLSKVSLAIKRIKMSVRSIHVYYGIEFRKHRSVALLELVRRSKKAQVCPQVCSLSKGCKLWINMKEAGIFFVYFFFRTFFFSAANPFACFICHAWLYHRKF